MPQANNTLIIRLLYLVAESDNDVSREEIELIKILQERYKVSNLDLSEIEELKLEEILEETTKEDLKEHISILIDLLKADGVIKPEELRIFNKIDESLFLK